MSIKVEFLSQADKERIHEASLRTLEEVGVEMPNEPLATLLCQAGAADAGGGRLRLPRRMVMERLALCPRTVTLTGLNGRQLNVGSGEKYNMSICIDPKMVDYDEGIRPPVVHDVVKQATLGDFLPKVHAVYKMDNICSDLPEHLSHLRTIEAILTHTTKHVYCAPGNMMSARIWTEMIDICNGGRSLAESPLLGCQVSTTSPLRLSSEEADVLAHMIRHGSPLVSLPCPMAGATSPFSLAGTVLMTTVENLFMIVLAQVIRPGHPVTAGGGETILNMRSGRISCGAVEKPMLTVAVAEMSKFYGLPTTGAMTQPDVFRFDAQNGAECAISAALVAGGPVDMRTGLGSLGNVMSVSTEQVLMAYDVLEMVEHARKGIAVNDKLLDYASIRRQGSGGSFLCEDLTMELLHTGEHFYDGSFDRSETNDPASAMLEQAHRRAEQILATHRAAVPAAIVEDLRRFVERHAGRTEWI